MGERHLKKAMKIRQKQLIFAKTGGVEKITVSSNSGIRQAIKVKCSDNNLFTVNKVFAFIEHDHSLEIEVIRKNGPVKVDKIVTDHTPVSFC